jgi:hypothetical protein
MFKTLSPILAACAAAIALSAPFHASAASAECEAKAVDKNGKALAGAAKASFLKKCEAGGGASSCDAKAVDKNGKALHGAAKTSFVKKCEADAKPAAAAAPAAASGAKK